MPRRKKRAASSQYLLLPSEGLSFLEQSAVRPSTQARYRRLLGQFALWATLLKIDWQTEAELDKAVVTFMEHQYAQGEPAHMASCLLAALRHHCPTVALDRASRAAIGWSRLRPAEQRLPLPRVAAAAIAGALVSQGHATMAVLVLLSFVCYLRPHEAISLRVENVVPPRPEAGTQYDSWGLILNDWEGQHPGKTGVFDESVLLDQDRWLWPPLQALTLARPSPGPLWDFSPYQLRQAWLNAVQTLGLAGLAPQLHSLRHGGASDDALTKRRTIQEIKMRGRWSSDQSLRRYAKATRLQAELRKMDPAVIYFGAQIEAQFTEVVTHFHQTRQMLVPLPTVARPRQGL